jgi:hypothetical protein
MEQKRSFFLLEIVIAIFLVGLFSVYFLRSSIHCLYKERQALLDIEFERKFDLKRMEVIRKYWGFDLPLRAEAKTLFLPAEVIFGKQSYTRTKKYKVYRRKGEHKECCGMVFEEEGKKYHFLVKKSEAKT